MSIKPVHACGYDFFSRFCYLIFFLSMEDFNENETNKVFIPYPVVKSNLINTWYLGLQAITVKADPDSGFVYDFGVDTDKVL